MSIQKSNDETIQVRLQVQLLALTQQNIAAVKTQQMQQKKEKQQVYREVLAMWRALKIWLKQANQATRGTTMSFLEHRGNNSCARHWKSIAALLQKRPSFRHRLVDRRRS
jgi:hypothetical protein